MKSVDLTPSFPKVKESLSGEQYLYKGNLFPEKVGKVEKDIFGEPTRIVDVNGRPVGNIKVTFTGKKIIVDEDGNEIGEYKE